MFNITFSTTESLREWLERKNWKCGSAEGFSEWLQNYFDSGNTISVNGEEYDFWACWELV